jgi:type VI secretion system protein ImpA
LIDVDALALPLGDDAPAGPNLEYDGDFLALDSAARGKPEQQFGDTIVPAEEPDWKEVRRMSLALLERTRDLRVAGLLTRALSHTDGMAGFAQGVELLTRLTTELWDHVHPQLDPDDGNDPFMRMSALSMLADGEGMQRGEGILRDLRGAEVVSARGMGSCRMRDAELALDLLEGSQETPTLSRTQIEGMFAEAVRAGAPDYVGSALNSVERLLAFLRETVGSVDAPDATMLLTRLKAISRLRAQAVSGGEPADGGDAETDSADSGGGGGTGAGPRPAGISGEIRNRDDALRMLNKVSEYLERHEPTNPAPLLIRRAHRLMTMSFVDIMKEMAPEGMDSLTKIAGADQVGTGESGY